LHDSSIKKLYLLKAYLRVFHPNAAKIMKISPELRSQGDHTYRNGSITGTNIYFSTIMHPAENI